MTSFGSIMVAPDNRVLCWTLVHFLWQGTAIALILWMARMWFPQRIPKARYGASCAAMLLCAAAPAVTFMVLHGQENHQQAIVSQNPIAVTADATPDAARVDATSLAPVAAGFDDATPAVSSIGDRINSAAPIVVVVWICGASLLALWRLTGWLWRTSFAAAAAS